MNWQMRLGLAIIVGFVAMTTLHPLLMGRAWEPAIYDPVLGFDPLSDLATKRGIDPAAHPAPPSLIHAPALWQARAAGDIGWDEFFFETLRHPLGTDPFGRDILSQLMAGAGSALALGVISAVVSVAIGTVVGSTAACFGGWADALLMRWADLLMLFPAIPFLMVVSSMVELSLFGLALMLGALSGFGGIAVVLKAQALSVKAQPYVEASRVSGGSRWWILRKHIVPGVLPLAFLYMMFNVTSAVLSEATLSFFGLLPVRVSWGLMIHTAQSTGYLLAFGAYWWLWLPPGLAITLLCGAFYLLGRGFEARFHPRLQNERRRSASLS